MMGGFHGLVKWCRNQTRLRNAVIVFHSESVVLLLGGCKQLSVSCVQNGWVGSDMWCSNQHRSDITDTNAVCRLPRRPKGMLPALVKLV